MPPVQTTLLLSSSGDVVVSTTGMFKELRGICALNDSCDRLNGPVLEERFGRDVKLTGVLTKLDTRRGMLLNANDKNTARCIADDKVVRFLITLVVIQSVFWRILLREDSLGLMAMRWLLRTASDEKNFNDECLCDGWNR